ncbi:uncharacterized protein [Nicotiana tomentosiformis]|uniref:uncharacterized protein n=1 Tax=Nicotiana tomentosiformis TaxID=4098 RepID=UPI00388C6F1C
MTCIPARILNGQVTGFLIGVKDYKIFDCEIKFSEGTLRLPAIELLNWHCTVILADDIVLIDETRGGVNERLEIWRQTLEFKGFKLSMTKTEYLECKFSGTTHVVDEESGGQTDYVLWDGVWPVKNSHVQKMKVAEMRMLRWMCGQTRLDRIRNEVIRDKVDVAPMEDKLRKARLRLFGHMKRRNTDAPVRRCERLALEGIRRDRVRPKKYWGEVIRQDMALLQLTEDMTMDKV